MLRNGAFRVAGWCCAAVIGVSGAGAFVGLDASSFWLDELLTAYYADPSIPATGALIERAAEDVHPPGYYLLVWLVTRVVEGPFDVVSRGLSAVLSVLALAALHVALPAGTGRFGRLVATASAASSVVWFHYAQEARSYALVFLLVTVLLAIAFRIRAAFARDAHAGGLLCAFALVGATGGLVHYYVVPLVGGIVALLILLARRWSQRLAVAVAGLVVLLPVAAFVRWHFDRIVVDPGRTWLKTTPDFLVRQTLGGLGYLIGSPVGVALAGLLVLLGLHALRRKGRSGGGAEAGAPAGDYALVVGSGVAAIGLAIAVTLVVPSYSYRQVVVLAPLFWALAGLLAHDIATTVRPMRPRIAWPVAMALAALLALQGAKVAWRDTPGKEPWRASAQAVVAMADCDGAALPVAWFGQPQTRGDELARVYGYYLPDGSGREWLPIPFERVTQAIETPPVRDVIAARIAGADSCPLLFWAVHGASRSLALEAMAAMNQSIAAEIDVPEGTRIEVRTFSTPASNWLRSALSNHRPAFAIQIVVVRD